MTNLLEYFLTPHSAEERAAVAWIGHAGPDVLRPLEAMLGRLSTEAFTAGQHEQVLIEAEHAAADRGRCRT